MTAPRKEPHEIKDYATAAFLGLACIVLIAMAVGFRDMRKTTDKQQVQLDSITDGSSPAGQLRLINQAQTRFLLCSRTDAVLTPAKRAERDIACRGYQTLAAAYRTQGVIRPPKDS